MTLVDEGVVKVDAAQSACLMPMDVINEIPHESFGYLRLGR